MNDAMTRDWDAWEERARAEATRHLRNPLWETTIKAMHEEHEDTVESWRELFERIKGDPDFNGPITLYAERDGKHYELRFTAEELDAVDYRELPLLILTDRPPDFKTQVLAAKLSLDRKRGYYTPTPTYMPSWMFEELKKS